MRLTIIAPVLALLLLPWSAAAEPAKYLFGAKAGPAQMAPDPFGSYAKGCLAGGMELPETGPGWQAMRLSRNRNWGHPEAIAFIQRLAGRGAAGRVAGALYRRYQPAARWADAVWPPIAPDRA